MSSSPSLDPAGASAASTPDRVRAAISNAAAQTGNSFDFLLAQARIESRLNPTAHAGTSTARGLYQFTEGSWLKTLERHGGDHGLGEAQAAILSGAARNPAQRAAILAMRNDPTASSLMAGELANDNRATLTAHLGRTPDGAELYLAHFLGADGANRFLDTLAATPQASAAALLPQAAGANRAIFYDPSGAPRSVAAVMQTIRARFDGAMTAGGADSSVMDYGLSSFGDDTFPVLPPLGGAGFPGAGALDPFDAAAISASAAAAPTGPMAQEFAATAAASPASASMADTLRSAFGIGGAASSAPDHVQAAYGQLARFGF
ncbi:lytic transglycosylase domain-containing protein [Novosphingobium sp.]|uniref:lytic transglycosylase domain-containing protein n=1 Tax=Novosphingobium sp. TaxID=1874826 RepID=UPI0025E28D20|nr:lytic transglycosylase domain-containing protein [Novosphingobium sp.]